MFLTSEKVNAIKGIAKLRAELVFIEAEIKHATKLIEERIIMLTHEENYEDRKELFDDLVRLHEKKEAIFQEVLDLEKVFFR